ncbi:MAG: SRPBCC family protein [Deltaproteobacteria bacterium]|nr:SRPBCC family protein [Deltaproteobacteria bacterium]
MAIEIQEQFCVSVPIDVVWAFLIDPKQVVSCMPGASLDEQLDDTRFLGSIEIKLGAVKTRYKCKVKLTAVDEDAHCLRISADGRETGGGTMKGTLTGSLRALPDAATEVACDATLELTGRIAQLGQGLVQNVARQLFRQFAEKMRERLEADPSTAANAVAAANPAPPVRVLPIFLGTLGAAIASWLRRLLGRNRP